MIRAAIFDLDGLLIDSEPLWEATEIAAFARVGLHLTHADCRQTTGLRIGEVVAHWHRRRPWSGAGPQQVEEDIVRGVAERILAEGAPLPGAARAVQVAADAGLALAIASSSNRRVIDAALQRLGFADRFQVVCSAEGLAHGKPHPAVFLDAAAKLGVHPTRCVAIEDSVNGAIAARAARMRLIAVPAAHHRDDPCFALADAVLWSLEDLDREHLGVGARTTPSE